MKENDDSERKSPNPRKNNWFFFKNEGKMEVLRRKGRIVWKFSGIRPNHLFFVWKWREMKGLERCGRIISKHLLFLEKRRKVDDLGEKRPEIYQNIDFSLKNEGKSKTLRGECAGFPLFLIQNWCKIDFLRKKTHNPPKSSQFLWKNRVGNLQFVQFFVPFSMKKMWFAQGLALLQKSCILR